MAFAYPESQFVRVWVSLGIIVSLVGLSAGIWRSDGVISARKIATTCAGAGSLIIIAGLMVKGPLERDESGQLIFTEDFEAIHGAWVDGLSTRIWWFLVGAVFIGIAAAIWFGLGDRRRKTFVPTVKLVYGIIGFLIATMWFVRYGPLQRPAADGTFYADRDALVAMSTRLPWTVMWIITGVAYQVGKRIDGVRSVRAVIIGLWAFAPFFIFWVILRDPSFDYGYVFAVDVPCISASAWRWGHHVGAPRSLDSVNSAGWRRSGSSSSRR